ADQVVVAQRTAVRVERPADAEDYLVHAALGVGELHLVTSRERASLNSRLHGAQGTRKAERAWLDAGEDLVEITGREHAEDLSGRVDEQVLGGRGAADRVEQCHPLQVGAEYQARVDAPGHRARFYP